MIHYFPTIVWLSTKTFVKVDVPFSEVLQNKPTSLNHWKKNLSQRMSKGCLTAMLLFFTLGFFPFLYNPNYIFSLFSHNAEEEKSLTSPTNRKCQYFFPFSFFLLLRTLLDKISLTIDAEFEWLIAVWNISKSILTCKWEFLDLLCTIE